MEIVIIKGCGKKTWQTRDGITMKKIVGSGDSGNVEAGFKNDYF